MRTFFSTIGGILLLVFCGLFLVGLTAWQASPLPRQKTAAIERSLTTLESRLHAAFREYPQAAAYTSNQRGNEDKEALAELHGIYLSCLGGIEECLNSQHASRFIVGQQLRPVKQAARKFLRRASKYDFLDGYTAADKARKELKAFLKQDRVL
jgi:hypothetical protein